MTLFTILGSGLGMLGAFVFHDMIKESLGSGVNRLSPVFGNGARVKIVVSVRASEFAKRVVWGLKSWLESSTLFSYWQLLFY